MTEFGKIYETYFRDVYSYMKRLSKDESIAEEMTSEAFFKAMRSIDSFRGDCDIRVWLCQIAKNCYLTYLKKARRFAELEILETSGASAYGDQVEELVVERSEALRIHRLTHELPEPYKEVFMLRVFGELSFRRIGSIFEKTENWACVTYHRARNKIIEKMEAGNDEK